MRVAILDDYQQVCLASTDWSAVRTVAEIDVFTEHIARTEALVGRPGAVRRDRGDAGAYVL